jgi:hypothetical protein
MWFCQPFCSAVFKTALIFCQNKAQDKIYMEQIGKAIFDVPFLTLSHAESMKKIMGAI